MTKSIQLSILTFFIFNYNEINSQSLCYNTATNYGAGASASSVASADFNGDGIKDLATTNQGSNTLSVLIGNGTGGFGAATNFTVGSQPSCVVSGDSMVMENLI